MTVPEDDLTSLLASVDLFAGLTPRALARIVESSHVARFEPGTEIVHAGEPVSGFRAFSPKGVEMHVVLEGAADVLVGGRLVDTIGPRGYFGELSLIDGQPRSADIVAGATGVTTLALPRWEFKDIIAEHPEVAMPMLRVVVARLRRAEAVTD